DGRNARILRAGAHVAYRPPRLAIGTEDLCEDVALAGEVVAPGKADCLAVPGDIGPDRIRFAVAYAGRRRRLAAGQPVERGGQKIDFVIAVALVEPGQRRLARCTDLEIGIDRCVAVSLAQAPMEHGPIAQ